MGPYSVTPAARYTASFLGLFVSNSLTVHPLLEGLPDFRVTLPSGDLRGTTTNDHIMTQFISEICIPKTSHINNLYIIEILPWASQPGFTT
jgi:hypothetical protein